MHNARGRARSPLWRSSCQLSALAAAAPAPAADIWAASATDTNTSAPSTAATAQSQFAAAHASDHDGARGISFHTGHPAHQRATSSRG